MNYFQIWVLITIFSIINIFLSHIINWPVTGNGFTFILIMGMFLLTGVIWGYELSSNKV